MTHDELLNDIGICLESNYTKILTDALRAVVELHKPLPEAEDSPFKDSCLGCGKTYPCKTIKIIEKELK
jgi:hypothetical protein